MERAKKILIIAYFYAPHANARAFRWQALAERWASQGHHVDVVCGWEPGFLHEENLNGVYVHRVNSMLTEKIRGSLKSADSRGKTQRPSQASPFGLQRIKQPLAAAARWIFHNVYKKLFWPDGGYLWRRPALKQIQALTAKIDYDTLVSVSPHFTAHLVGIATHRRLPDLRWLVDIGDPFSFLDVETPNNRLLYSTLNRRVERNVFREADAISVTTELTRQGYADIFPESAAKIQVIPPLLSLPDAATGGQTKALFLDSDKIYLAFIGLLYAHIRPPDFLLKLFQSLMQTPLAERLELHFFGDARQVHAHFEPYADLLDRKIFLHGNVSRERVVQVMQEATVLVNIGNKTTYQLPSKVVEYAHSGKPIVNIGQLKNDSSALFFAQYPAAITLYDGDQAGLAQQADQLYSFLSHLPPPVDQETISKLLNPFQLNAVGETYSQLISRGES